MAAITASACASETSGARGEFADGEAPDGGELNGADAADDGDAKDEERGPLCTSEWVGAELLPWQFVPSEAASPDGGARSASDAGAASDARAPLTPGCTTAGTAGGSNVTTCVGSARVDTNGSALSLILEDGSTLTWMDTHDASAVRPPFVSNGDTVWVEYEEANIVVCPFCGEYQERALTIRAADGGVVLWIADENQEDETANTVSMELFDAEVETRLSCYLPRRTYDCWVVDPYVFDRVVRTSPETIVPYGQVTTVTSEKGAYDVFWASTGHDSERIPMCSDGKYYRSGTRFAAVRLPE